MIISLAAFVVGVCLALFFPIVIQAEFLQITSVVVLSVALALAEAVRFVLNKKLNLKWIIIVILCELLLLYKFSVAAMLTIFIFIFAYIFNFNFSLISLTTRIFLNKMGIVLRE